MSDLRGESSPGPAPRPAGGLFSLTQIQHLMRVEFSRAQRYGYPVGVLVLAVDDLEGLRDRLGYEGRAEALGTATRLLEETTRSCDHLGRLMDDRLMAILPHTSLEGTRRTAERLVEAARALVPSGPLAGAELRLSVGVSALEGDGTLFFDALVEAAEMALARARAAGGNRVAVHGSGEGVATP